MVSHCKPDVNSAAHTLAQLGLNVPSDVILQWDDDVPADIAGIIRAYSAHIVFQGENELRLAGWHDHI